MSNASKCLPPDFNVCVQKVKLSIELFCSSGAAEGMQQRRRGEEGEERRERRGGEEQTDQILEPLPQFRESSRAAIKGGLPV